MRKQDIKIKEDKIELISIGIISFIIISAFLVRLLNLDNIKFVQILTGLIISNIWNLLFLIACLFVIYLVKKKNLQKEINELNYSEENKANERN